MQEALTVKHLLSGNLLDKYRDKVFWYASSVEKSGNILDINIDNQNIVAFDNYAMEVKGARAISEFTVSNSTDIGSKPIKNVLVSSGSFLWVNDKLLITQRTADTKYDPLAWTTPAGRCDDTPLRTALKETIEEIQIQSKTSKNLWLPDLAKKAGIIKGKASFYSSSIQFPAYLPQELTDVRTWLDGELLEETQLWYFYNNKNNTLEFRLPMRVVIDDELTYTNPEYHTKTIASSFEYLNELDVVPALKRLLASV